MMSETPSTTELWEKLRQRCKGEPTLLAQFDSLRTHMEQARLREALLRNRIRQDEVRYFNLHQKLIKAEKALDDARRDYDEDTHDLKDRLAKAEQENRQWREMTDPPYDAPYIESQRARIEQLELRNKGLEKALIQTAQDTSATDNARLRVQLAKAEQELGRLRATRGTAKSKRQAAQRSAKSNAEGLKVMRERAEKAEQERDEARVALVFLDHLADLAANWRYSDEFIGNVVRSRFPAVDFSLSQEPQEPAG
jgi:chromosome segregation ATPase